MTRAERIQAARDKIGQDIPRKPHLKQFFTITKIADEPPLNTKGFWPKPTFHETFPPPKDVNERLRKKT